MLYFRSVESFFDDLDCQNYRAKPLLTTQAEDSWSTTGHSGPVLLDDDRGCTDILRNRLVR